MTSSTTPQTLWEKELLDEEAKIGRVLAGGYTPSLARAIIRHRSLSCCVFDLFMKQISTECDCLCRRGMSVASIFRKIPVSQLNQFKWESCIEELKTTAPLLLQMLTTMVGKNDARNMQKRDTAHYPGICFAVAVILKERSREMCGLQSLVSLLLMASGVEKKVTI